MTKITISLILAYLMAGVSQVTEDLAADPVRRPFWTLRPMVGQIIYAGATWVVRPFNEAAYSTLVANPVPFAFVRTALRLAIIAGFVWCCISVSVYLFHNMALQITAVTALLIIGTRFVLPWLGRLSVPLALIITLPIDLLFPLTTDATKTNIDTPAPRRLSSQITVAQPTETPPLTAQSDEMLKADNSDLPKQMPSADETPSKTDYYPVVARAISSLSECTLDARQALYDRARSALTTELNHHEPPLTEADMTRERHALETAIDNVEKQWSPPVATPQHSTAEQNTAGRHQQLTQLSRDMDALMREINKSHEERRLTRQSGPVTQDEIVQFVLSAIEMLIAVQLSPQYETPYHAFSSIIANKIASGYIFGFHEAFVERCRLMDINEQAPGLSVIRNSYEHLFGKLPGSTLFDACRYSLKDLAFHRGRISGGNDFIEFMRREIPPVSLATILILGNDR
jgi:hypothetical protein